MRSLTEAFSRSQELQKWTDDETSDHAGLERALKVGLHLARGVRSCFVDDLVMLDDDGPRMTTTVSGADVLCWDARRC